MFSNRKHVRINDTTEPKKVFVNVAIGLACRQAKTLHFMKMNLYSWLFGQLHMATQNKIVRMVES